MGDCMNQVICGDCLDVMRSMEDGSVDLVFGSPPYEDARLYGKTLSGQDWVDWMCEVYRESLRVCKGLVSYVVQGRTRKFRWSATPALLMADLHRQGVHLREGPYYHRVGIPGSGGPDWLRHDIEFMVSATNGGRLPWSDNTVMGTPPKYENGGPCSHRKQDCNRVVSDRATRKYVKPKLSNPGNVIHCTVGGGKMGSDLAHENEAPFPEKLAEFMVRSFCPPGGVVLDPFAGSGTTGAVALKCGRRYVLIDNRQSQIELIERRIEEVKQIMEKTSEGES